MRSLTIFSVALILISSAANAALVDDMQAEFEQQANTANASAGETLWKQTFIDTESGQQRSCASCHSDDLYKAGKHVRTGKVIDAMAPSVTAARFTERRKINKWFKRNCNWTLGRECSAQEKADLLAYLKQL